MSEVKHFEASWFDRPPNAKRGEAKFVHAVGNGCTLQGNAFRSRIIEFYPTAITEGAVKVLVDIRHLHFVENQRSMFDNRFGLLSQNKGWGKE